MIGLMVGGVSHAFTNHCVFSMIGNKIFRQHNQWQRLFIDDDISDQPPIQKDINQIESQRYKLQEQIKHPIVSDIIRIIAHISNKQSNRCLGLPSRMLL